MRAPFVEQRLKFDGMKDEYPHRELSAAIIGAAMNVLNGLRPGLDEKIYENSLVLELIAQGHQVEQQRRFPVHYRGHLVGTLVPDILVDEKVIVDPKVVEAFTNDHIAQDARLPCDQRVRVGAASQFQICQASLETSR
jgi:GxxExxY protein